MFYPPIKHFSYWLPFPLGYFISNNNIMQKTLFPCQIVLEKWSKMSWKSWKCPGIPVGKEWPPSVVVPQVVKSQCNLHAAAPRMSETLLRLHLHAPTCLKSFTSAIYCRPAWMLKILISCSM